ncbi:MAG: GGDEF domain-containing protein, partial [Solirubrobacterales bacterium]|nr:GGDEF domain-containing protein [Solirubrobacterales bacterium]
GLTAGTISRAAAGSAPATAGVAPATAAAGANSGARSPTRPATAETGRAAAGSHSSGQPPNTGEVTVPPAVFPKLVNHVPDIVWVALAASLVLAATGAAAALAFRRTARRQADHFAAVEAAALTDPLTGVLNRRGFTEAVERELARARRYERPFVLAYVDVRGLKGVNDTAGHLAGDKLLKCVAELLTDSARADDVVGRLGGDELGLLLAEQSPEAAAVVTQRIAAQVPQRRAALGLSVPWSLTVGTAAFPQDGETLDELIGAADRRLYEQRGIDLKQ